MGEDVTPVNSTRLQSLLAFVLLHHQTPISRQQLAVLFWPDTSEAQARTNLRNLIYQLRHALPDVDRYLKFEGQTVQLVKSASLVLDVHEFEKAVRLAQGQTDGLEYLIRAVEIYRGDLLPDCYDEWLDPERERLSRLFANSLDRLVILLERKRDYLAAIAFAERLLGLDELNENAYRHLMRLHSLLGDRTKALHVYQTCAAVLKNELSIEPDKETRDLFERLKNSDANTPAFPAASAESRIKPLVGREREWTEMQQAWGRAVEGHPHCII
ncbi:MAG: 6-hydroxy-D-nicotine oxidase, partial [Anaerolineaceae bacterium]|nr:6-hydroxy-D-nicotine oxidase [Anaerolineaceae bacterium]